MIPEAPMPPPAGLWAALPIPGLVIDQDDRICDMNPAAEEFLNLSARNSRGQPLFDRVSIDAPMEEAFLRVRNGEVAMTLNTVDVGTGERAPVSTTLYLSALPEAGADAILLLLSPRELANRLDRAQSVKSAAKSAIGMSEMLAHEIKNPLAGITGASQLLSMNLSPEDQELTDLIVEESKRIVKLLEQVEQFGNLRPPELQAVNIHDLLDRARKSALVGYAAHMTIEEDYDPSLPDTYADGDQLLQVFLNLLKNAAEASGNRPGRIRLHTFYDAALRIRRADGTPRRLPLQVEIIDDGPGLPPAIAQDIFEPFVSGKENGTGLGLALVSKIVSDHDGWIAVDSVPGRTVFRISLPIAPPTAPKHPEDE
nr:ATP-binding protein [Haematobacter massiliensis]